MITANRQGRRGGKREEREGEREKEVKEDTLKSLKWMLGNKGRKEEDKKRTRDN